MTFIPYFIHVIFLLIITILAYFQLWIFSLVVLLFYLFSFVVLRKNRVPIEDIPYALSDSFVSPVNGTVLFIEEGSSHNIIQFRVNLWNEYSVRSPRIFEVKELEKRDGHRPTFRYFQRRPVTNSSLDLLMGGDSKSDYVMVGFKRCFLGFPPFIKLIPGDRASSGAIVGIFPLGGSVLLYLPKKYKISLKSKQRVIAGVTVVAEGE